MVLRRLLAALLFLPALLSCAEDDPDPPDTGDPTTPATTHPTETEPTIPADARKPTERGAIAFVEHWVEVLNESQATGDIAALRDLSAKNCRSCRGAMEWTRRIYENDGSISGGDWRLLSVNAYPHQSMTRMRLATVIRYAEMTVTSGDGEKDRVKPANDLIDFEVEYDGRWQVREFKVIQS